MSIKYAVSKKTSPRLLLLLLIVSVTLICSACSDNAPEKENASAFSAEAQTDSSDKPEVFTTGDTAVFDTLKITANELKEVKSDQNGFSSAAEGKIFTGINFTAENISGESQTVSSLMLFEAYVDGTKCDFSFSAATAFPEGTIDGEVAPGKKITGWYTLELPENWTKLELHIAGSWLSEERAVFTFSK